MISISKSYFLISLIIFIFTLTFSYSFTLISNTETYIKEIRCFSGGILIATMLFHIFPDFYKSSIITPFFAGFSFLFLFSVDKLYNIDDKIPDGKTTLECLVLISALSLHSFFEGLGIASEDDSRWYLFGLLGHKWIEAFVLGSSVNDNFNKLATFLIILFYSLLTPIGCMLAHSILNISKIFKNFLLGLAGGSFIYIGFIEMVGNQFRDNEKCGYRLVAVCSGFSLMAGVSLILEILERRRRISR
ncbi:Zinc transporter ZIP1 [Dictyocoela muelleri]|nr:Zinc transporter ZIP1 [Dictyocoela muelleri]